MMRSEEFDSTSATVVRSHLLPTRASVRSRANGAAARRVSLPITPILIFAIAIFLVPPHCAHAEAIWVIDTLDAALDASSYSLAIDSMDRLHVSFQDGPTKALHYGTVVSGAWTTEDVGDSGFYNCLAVTPEGDPGISFTFDKRLYLARRPAGTWTIELADPTHTTSWRFLPSIGLDFDGHAHITAYDTGTSIFYSTDKSGSWTSERMNSGAGDDVAPIVMRADGVPWAAYPEICCYGYQSNLYLADREEAGWERVTADSSECYHSGIHLAFGPNGRPHIANRKIVQFIDTGSYHVQYLHQTEGGTWITEEIDGIGHDPMLDENYISAVNLALDRDGSPHILYKKHIYEHESGEDPQDYFYHAYKEAGVWVKEAILTIPVRGNGIVIDRNNVPCVLFGLSEPTYGLYLARRIDATGVVSEPRPPKGLRLAIAPNPMRASGTISFTLGGGAADLAAGGEVLAGGEASPRASRS